MVTKIIGAPGTGKTTRLLEILEDELKYTTIERVAYVSFTKSAINEAKNRTIIKYGFEKNDCRYFRTLHSLAYRQLGIRSNNMLTTNLMNKFVNIMGDIGIDIIFNYDEDDYNEVRSIPLYLYNLSKNKMEDIRKTYYDGRYNVSLSDVLYVMKSYNEFKKYYNVIDFNDLFNLEKLTKINDVDVVFLDEAQDLTKLQLEVFNIFFGNVKNIYIAGDDDQSIYTWAGVDINNFLNISYDNQIILKKSHRLPEKILSFSKKIIRKVGNRIKKNINSNGNKGNVENIIGLGEIDEKIKKNNGESWLFLIRNTYFYRTIERKLIEFGVPFMKFGKNYIEKQEINAIYNWESHRKNNTKLNKTLLGNYTNTLDVTKNWYELFQYMSIDNSNYYRSILSNGFKLKGEKINIEITTMHKSKGREADNVVILPDITTSTNNTLENNPDNEHRVFYVASTRAKNNLYIMHNETKKYYNF